MTLTPPALTAVLTAAQLRGILAAARDYHLGNSTLGILAYLHEHGTGSLVTLARAARLSTAATTGLADRLVALGYAARRPSIADRRVVWLDITPSGTATLEDILTTANS